METRDHRELSRQTWVLGDEKDRPTIEDLQLGCMLRIADSMEVISTNYTQLLNDVKYYKERLQAEQAENARMAKRIAGLKGHINRLKKSA